MNIEVLERRFAAIGARARVGGTVRGGFRIDVIGDVFHLHCTGRGAPDDVDVDCAGRHLVLLVRQEGWKSKFLCGHDERQWFVAAIPEDARGVTGVATAKETLQPQLVRDAIERRKPKDRFRRRNPVYVRQDEWFLRPRARSGHLERRRSPPRAALARRRHAPRSRACVPARRRPCLGAWRSRPRRDRVPGFSPRGSGERAAGARRCAIRSSSPRAPSVTPTTPLSCCAGGIGS